MRPPGQHFDLLGQEENYNSIKIQCHQIKHPGKNNLEIVWTKNNPKKDSRNKKAQSG